MSNDIARRADQPEETLADRRRFTVSQEQWDELNRLLDTPPEDLSPLRRLVARPSPFSGSESD